MSQGAKLVLQALGITRSRIHGTERMERWEREPILSESRAAKNPIDSAWRRLKGNASHLGAPPILRQMELLL